MNPGDIDLDALLKRLHLPTVRRLYPGYATRAAAEGWSHRDFLALLIAEEVAHRNDTRVQKAARHAHFPFIKTIEEFDFVFQSSLRRQQLGPYLGPELISEGRNLVLSGRPGRGKTHLGVAIGYRAIQNGFTARFVGASALIDELGAASRAGRLNEATAAWVTPDVLIVDEVGYLQHAEKYPLSEAHLPPRLASREGVGRSPRCPFPRQRNAGARSSPTFSGRACRSVSSPPVAT